jgi:hypothetical protein
MNSNPAALIACDSVLDPILDQLTAMLDEHSPNFTGAVAEALVSAAVNRRRYQRDDLGRHPRDARGRYHPSAAGLSLHTAAMVMPTHVLPHETRARCAVNDFLDSEPAVLVRNVH